MEAQENEKLLDDQNELEARQANEDMRKIISEIEELKDEMGEPSQKAVPDEPWIAETLSHLRTPVPEKTGGTESSGADTSGFLSMNIRGKMTIQLNYESDQSVTVLFTGDGFQIKMADGTELRVPLQSKAIKKVA